MKRNLDWQRVCAIALVAVMFVATFAQADVVYLKDGGVIKGKVIEAVPGVSYKIRTADGSIFVFEIDKVEKINYEGEGEPRVEKGKSVDVIYLKDGGVIKGNIIETTPGKSYKIRTADGSVFVFTMEKIEKIEFGKEVEVEGVKPVKRAEAQPSAVVKTSIGGGVDIFKVSGCGGDGLYGKNVNGWGKGVAGDMRFMGKNCGIQLEVGSKEHEGDNEQYSFIKETYKCFSWGATALLSNKVSPKALFYGGGGVSHYGWDYSAKTPWLYIGYVYAGQLPLVAPVSSRYDVYIANFRFKEENWGWHLCGGMEYAISENLSLCGEIRRIMGTIEEPEYTYDSMIKDSYGNTAYTTVTGTGEDWDYSHTDFKAGLRISF
ncbi:MAG: outer membrane beta-barrel protein [bacterium]